jgi:tetratricopeptide (TPR) repeat protein
MPRGDTEIPHIAFSHHRIGRHTARPQQSPAPARIPNLVPLDENPHLSAPDRQRNLGLAYLQVLQLNPAVAGYARVYHDRARENLEAAYRAGIRDAEVLFSLSQIYQKQGNNADAADYARKTLGTKDLHPDLRAHSLLSLARSEFAASDPAAAARLLEEAVQSRRFAEDWQLLGASYLELNRTENALTAFRQALSIRPDRHITHLGLSECYRRLGDGRGAEDALVKAQWLMRNRKD